MDVFRNYKSTMYCNMCSAKNSASYACNKCNKFLCMVCKEAHDKMVCFQNHQLESLDITDILQNGTLHGLLPLENGTASSNLFDEILKMSSKQEGELNGASAKVLENGEATICTEIIKILDILPNENDKSSRNPSPLLSICCGSSLQPIPDPDIAYSTIMQLNINDTSDIQRNVHRMQVYKTFGQRGTDRGQFNSPHGLCLGFNDDIVVADSLNHRIQIFDKYGNYKSEFGRMGRTDGHLWHPRKVAILAKSRKYIVCDRGSGRSRMQIFNLHGVYLQKIYISYIEIVAGLTVTDNEDIILVDSVRPTIFILDLKDSLRTLDCRKYINEPSDIATKNQLLYVCDFKGHSIVVLDFDGNFLRKFGREHITNYPNGIDISNGFILTGDSHGNYFHVTVFTESGEFIKEFRCPYVKASRCCGLKLTCGGRIVTIDKNFHHVIIIDKIDLV